MYDAVMGNKSFPGTGQHILGMFDGNGEYQSSTLVLAENYYSQPHLAITPKGEVVYAASFNAGAPLLLAKYGPTGANLFKKTTDNIRANGYAEDVIWSSDTDADGGFSVIGSFEAVTIGGQTYNSYSGSDDDCFLIKYNSNGEMEWVRKGGGQSADFALASATDKSDGSIYTAGTFSSEPAAFGFNVLHKPPGSRSAPFITKYSRTGEVLWSLSPDFSGLARIVSLAMAPDGALVFAGTSFSDSAGDEKTALSTFLGKCSSAGAIEWIKPAGSSIFGIYPRAIPSVKVHPNGDIYLAFTFNGTVALGSSTYSSVGSNDILLGKFTPEGLPIWAKTAGFIGDDRATALWIDEQGRVLLVGTVAFVGVFDDKRIEGNQSRTIFLARLQNSEDNFPKITGHPLSQSALIGGSATFQVMTSSPTLVTYQWFFNDKPIPGARSSTYTIPSVTAANEGYYFVEVTNDAGTVRSASGQLVIKGQVPVLVTTVAGTNVSGYMDSSIGSNARFYQPNGLAYFSGGLIAVADGFNHLIRLVDPGTGATDTYAGQNTAGYLDGPSKSAKFHSPLGLTVAKSLDVLVADYSNNLIRRISSFGLRNVSTVAGTGMAGYRDGNAGEAQFNSPNDLVVDANGNVFVTEFTNHTVRKITPNGDVSTFAGNGTAGYRDGMGTSAQFNQPGGLTIDPAGNLYVTEWTGGRVRKITPQGLVTTIAGTNKTGFVDGQGSAALFWLPDGITIDPVGNLYMTEAGNMAVRKIDPQGNVTTVAGLGVPGFKDGDKGTAMFNVPGGIMWHPSGSLYVSDTGNNAIRRIDFLNGQTNSDSAELLISLNPTLTIFGKSGATYRIEGAEAGSGPLDWTILDTITITNNAEMWADPQPATRQKRYYRAVKVN